jgi:hypothetical protein
MRAWHQLSLSLAVVVATAACVGERKSDWGESCDYSDHCESTLACYAKRCAPLNGTRTVTDAVGDLYEGVFKDGHMVSGHITHEAGGHSQGKFEKGLLVDGEHRDAEGVRTVGTFRRGRFVQGTRHAPDGTYATGDFESNGLSKGVRSLADGTVETGLFAYGKLTKGQRRHRDGRLLDGNFDDEGRLSCDECEMTTAEGDVIKGRFRKGRPKGKVHLKRADGAHFHGDLVDSEFEGDVRANLPDGSVLRGRMVDGGLLVGEKTLRGGGFEEGLFRRDKLVTGWRVDLVGNVTIVE